MDVILKLVEGETGFTLAQLRERGRKREAVLARALFTIICTQKGFSASSIARKINRDHTSIIHLRRKFENAPWIKEVIDKNEEQLKGTVRVRVKLRGRYGYLKARFGGRCVVCGFDEIVEVHHILPQHLGGTDDPENLVVLCPNHHALADRGMLEIKDMHIKVGYQQD